MNNPNNAFPGIPTSLEKPIKRIGVLTGGGDCPGLNAVIRAVTKTAIFDHGWEVIGIHDGFLGLIENNATQLDQHAVSNILTEGGTILGSSNKANPQKFATGTDKLGQPIFEDVTDRCLHHINRRGIDALVVIGGDGTMSAAEPIIRAGVPAIGVPKTIDNDVHGTELTFGFLTASNTATEALDRLHSTAASHHRVMIAEVMGRNAGWIALHAGVASGADVILIPEIPFDIEHVADVCLARTRFGKSFTIICIAEGAAPKGHDKFTRKLDPTSPDPVKLGGAGHFLAEKLEDITKLETRCTVLGYTQRGGTPTPADRVLATQFGYHATTLLANGHANRPGVIQDHRCTDTHILAACNKQRTVPPEHPLVHAARAVRTSFGDTPATKLNHATSAPPPPATIHHTPLTV